MDEKQLQAPHITWVGSHICQTTLNTIIKQSKKSSSSPLPFYITGADMSAWWLSRRLSRYGCRRQGGISEETQNGSCEKILTPTKWKLLWVKLERKPLPSQTPTLK